MTVTFADLIASTCRTFRYYREGAATSAGTTTKVYDSGLIEPSDFWNGWYIYILDADAAAPEGEERRVSDYAPGAAGLTIEPAFTVAVDSGDLYELIPVRRSELKAAIAGAIRAAGNGWLVPTLDNTTVTPAAATYEYSLPTDLVHLMGVWSRASTADPWVRVPTSSWEIAGPSGAAQLMFQRLDYVTAGVPLRLDYLKRLTQPSADTDTLGLGIPAEDELVEFVVSYAAHLLHTREVSRGPTAASARAHITQAQACREAAELIKLRVRAPFGTGSAQLPARSQSMG